MGKKKNVAWNKRRDLFHRDHETIDVIRYVLIGLWFV